MQQSNHAPIPRSLFARPISTCVIAAATSFLLWCAFDWWQAGPEPQVVTDAIPLLAWYALAIVGIAALLRRLSRPTPDYAQVLAWLSCVLPALILVFCLGTAFLISATASAAALCVTFLCAFAYLSHGLRVLTAATQFAAASAGVLALAGCIWLSAELNVIPDLWAPAEAGAEPPPASAAAALVDEETILFSQAPRIDAKLATFSTNPSAAARSFFLGFAGVGDEKVFAQEIALATRVIGKRYATGGRELSLINDQRDLDSAPLASVSGLRYALRAIAARMNIDRDVLFLAISSHGAEDPAIIVSNSDLPLNDLTPSSLSDALRDSGVKWRVIIISACYAGGFVDALKNPQTIVITAAAADRTSFGCASDSDLTYFGEAFYRDALPEAKSLREAFTAARSAIAAREHREHVDASRPQAYFGEDITAKLDATPPRLTGSSAP